MAHYWSDNVLTTAFTPRDYQVELLAAAREKNIIICLGHNSSKEFIALKLIHELGFQLRNSNKRKISLYLTGGNSAESFFNLIYHLTDLKVVNLNVIESDLIDWETLTNDYQVIILNIETCFNAVACSYIDLNFVNLIIIEDCHKIYGKSELIDLLENFYKNCEEKPKILGLAGPLHSAGCRPAHLGAELEQLEKFLNAKAETASDIVTVLRYSSKPNEILLQCAPPHRDSLTEFLKDLVLTKQDFIKDHRFDPLEIYEGFQDEIKGIPDPKIEPLKLLNEYLQTLEELGPWCSDRAAFTLLVQIEKCKVKTPYERHFLLLCMISTTLVQIRAHCDYVFQKLPNEKERILNYSSPKILRLLEVIRQFKPETRESNEIKIKTNDELIFDEDGSKIITPRNVENLENIDKLDFKKLNDSVEKIVENITQPKSTEAAEIKSALTKILLNDENQPHSTTSLISNSNFMRNSPIRGGLRKKHRLRNHLNPTGGPFNSYRRHNSHFQNDSDALCGLIFCNSKFFAKILFSLFCEMTRSDDEFKFLNVQYTVEKEADPMIDLKEAETEHRKQEEVLKRFRMHECNLLIGTSVLEEGIDLPKCNLVIRWDIPTTYRSYVQCKGRARAQNAYHIIMVASNVSLKETNENIEILAKKVHKFTCFPGSMDSFNISNKISKTRINKNNYSNEDGENENKKNSNDVNESCENTDASDDENSINEFNECSVQLESDESNGIKISLDKDEILQNEYYNNMNSTTDEMIKRLAQYKDIEMMLLRKCENFEPMDEELHHADLFTQCVQEYRPIVNDLNSSSVSLSTAVSLVNKYCAKLPSDTFTKLTPLWRLCKTKRNFIEVYQCTLRLPINSPLKEDIIGLPMPTRILARRVAALIACSILHKTGELDDNLQPIGKENFHAIEPDWENFELEEEDEQIVSANSEPRPGTTKRRQYYYKRIASTFSNCRPQVGEQAYLYHISMILTCPIPEEQNTRGRKIYPPEDAVQGFGILTTKQIPSVSSFPIFTRSGEVKVSLELAQSDVIFNEEQLKKIYTFISYTFTNVLRLQKYLMLFDPEATENSFFIVPVLRVNNTINVDWDFLHVITENVDKMPKEIPEDERKLQNFDPNKFKDAVVMPWYRNQDQPQYFYVAEICYHLSPCSSFPGENYSTFEEYYFRKYNIQIQNTKQPLLDVDHTSARLNFLTPRYVNRKGVALPTSSEETKRAKRENLEQKQILVPELCTIHPFPASLWRAAVCLPCILYRINALLLADEIRKKVAYDLGLGKINLIYENFEWPALDFGWSLADVLKKSREARQISITEITDKKFELNENKKISEEMEDVGQEDVNEKTANDILEEAELKEKKSKNNNLLEIGVWSNEMAEDIPEDDLINEWSLPDNINICSRNKTKIRYGSPTSWEIDVKENLVENYFSDSDVSYQSDDEQDNVSEMSNNEKITGLRIEFKSDHLAEAIETEEEILKREKQLAIINNHNINEKNYQNTKNIYSGFDCCLHSDELEKKIKWHETLFEVSTKKLQEIIKTSGILVKYDQKVEINIKKDSNRDSTKPPTLKLLYELFPYMEFDDIKNFIYKKKNTENSIQLSIKNLYELNKIHLNQSSCENYLIEGTGDVFDNFNDNVLLKTNSDGKKEMVIDFTEKNYKINKSPLQPSSIEDILIINNVKKQKLNDFSFDYQPNLNNHPGPSPSIILQALTMSNANDGINLERLETIGDSFLKYAITTYLYCCYENVHEGKLSHLRSKQVSNLNLYRLGRKKVLGESMIATKFEPHDNWLPPCYYVPKELEKALIEAKIPACYWHLAEVPNLKQLTVDEICVLVKEKAEALGLMDEDDIPMDPYNPNPNGIINLDNYPCFIPYNLVTQHSIPDKSIADCVEALIGAYLIECGPRGALLFMAWLGIRVLPITEIKYNKSIDRIPGSSLPFIKNKDSYQSVYGHWIAPRSPLLDFAPNSKDSLERLLDGYSSFEDAIGYHFNDRSYLLQAMTHASYSPNRLTDCYQRLEFLGDAVLDYLITRHLYEDPRQHSPGALTDLRSALVNNTIFASLAVRHGFHKYFRHLSPALNEVIDRFVRIQHENGHSISEEYYLLSEEECDEAEDVEVPKALGDVFESVAGAIFLDSNMALDVVWNVYSNMMKPEIEQFSNSVPKSPIRELLELEPETAKFGKPEKLADGRRVRVTVEVFGKGIFRGIGRNYRIAKCTAAKCALRQLKKQGLISKKH